MTEAKCRAIVNARANGRCERCGQTKATTIHHRRKRSHGGPWTPRNCVALCGHGTIGCHSWVEHNPDAAHSEGWHIKPWEDERTVPIPHFSEFFGDVWLDDEGLYWFSTPPS